jgi:cytochrome c-type biogenesis protein CcmH/NrfG
VPPETAEILHCLGYVYLRQGQARRAAVLLMLASRAAPRSPGILRTLAAAMVGCGLGDRAIEVLDAADRLDPVGGAAPMAGVLRARALLAQGRKEDARATFRASTSQSRAA